MWCFSPSAAAPRPSTADAPNELQNSCFLSHTQFCKQKNHRVFCSPSLFPCASCYTSGDPAESFQRINHLRRRERQRSTCWRRDGNTALDSVSYSLWLSDLSHLHPVGLGSICGNSYTANWARLTLRCSDTKVSWVPHHTWTKFPAADIVEGVPALHGGCNYTIFKAPSDPNQSAFLLCILRATTTSLNLSNFLKEGPALGTTATQVG